ncbi:MAG: hypothetical protein DRH17_13155 [Deltaproteobacteria bacterium]|nr:MAG: hypothetical protein DRH17_13155 [Deltaproteobacteria bacterium]
MIDLLRKILVKLKALLFGDPVVIASKTPYSGSVTPTDLNVETTVIEITGESDDYIVEGYIDLSQMQSGDEVEVREYIAVDGTNYRIFLKATFSGVQEQPVVRFHAKTLLSSMKYKVTLIQRAGTLRTFPYSFIKEVMGSA